MRERRSKSYYVYILASSPRGVLYVGMSSTLANRTWQHRARVMEGFTTRYWVNRLVYFEAHVDAKDAARRERALKRWRRDWKIELIEKGQSHVARSIRRHRAGRRLRVVSDGSTIARGKDPG